MQIIDEQFDPARIVIDDAREVLRYLTDAALIMCALGPFPDQIDPARQIRHNGWVTDGTFVWPLATAYYVREHRLAAPASLLAHIRAQGYLCPSVSATEAHAVRKVLRRRRS